MKRILTSAIFLTIIVSALASAGEASVPKLSVQLWSVKDDLKSDFNGTIDSLVEMGFEGIELAGYFGDFAQDPEGLATYFELKGLEISGAHVGFGAFDDASFDKTISFYKAAGVKTLIIPADNRALKPDTVSGTIADLNKLVTKLEPLGFKLGYHNHEYEFVEFDGKTNWDRIAESTPKSMVLQLDVGWVNFAEEDPVKFVHKYPGRTFSTHYKASLRQSESDTGKLPIIGKDTIDWVALIKANIEVGGTQWIVVEQEEYPNGLTPLEALAQSKKGLDLFLSEYRSQSVDD